MSTIISIAERFGHFSSKFDHLCISITMQL